MACMKLGSKTDAFQRQGQAWFCSTGLPSDIVVEVEKMSFHLHKFPLLSRSGLMERMISDASEEEESCSVVHLPNIPGGARTFELVAKFCYGVKLELTASNIVSLRCAAEHLEMSEEYGEGNLVERTESFLSKTVLMNWKDSLKALQTCDDVLSCADELNITERCIESLAAKAESDPNAHGWPLVGPGQSPGGTLMWNGIKIGDCERNPSSGWWYEDASTLSFVVYKRLILAMESHRVRLEVISGSLMSYAKKYLSGLNRRQGSANPSTRISEQEQRKLLEEIDELLPLQKGVVPTKFLFGLLRTAIILNASSSSMSNLEKRIGLQLDEATLEDVLIPTFCHSMETLYNVECVQRILDHFLAVDGAASPCFDDGDEHSICSGSLTPITMVAKLMDGYLAEVASDINLKLPKFEALAGAVPEFARPLDDGLYRAIDIYLKSHPWLSDVEREHLCRLLDCQKLSIEACTHAAQNERLPIRVIVQVLFFEQLQLRTSIAGCLMVSDNLDRSRPLGRGGGGGGIENTEDGWATATNENQVLKVGMDSMRTRVLELEKECTNMRLEIENLGRVKGLSVASSGSGWGNVSKRFGFKLKSSMCNAQADSVSDTSRRGEKNEKRH